MNFHDDWVRSRRTFILRFLVGADGVAPESAVRRAAFRGGFERDTADDIALDLNHLVRMLCVTESHPGGDLRVIRLTALGEDAARGKIDVPGVERSRWSPGEA